MSKRVTLGGEGRLGSGKKMKVDLKTFERSTHDLGYIWRSTMAPGTLVPFINEVALPGDTFEIDLDSVIKTYPTAGPLFGSFKAQYDVFLCPIRLYQGQLHNNKLGIGMKMANVKLPKLSITTKSLDLESDLPFEVQQVNPSSLISYLGIRGIGRSIAEPPQSSVTREFNAVPYLAYWDIYKNYYANRQEEIGAVIHTENYDEGEILDGFMERTGVESFGTKTRIQRGGLLTGISTAERTINSSITLKLYGTAINTTNVLINIASPTTQSIKLADFFDSIQTYTDEDGTMIPRGARQKGANVGIICQGLKNTALSGSVLAEETFTIEETNDITQKGIEVYTFPLENLDEMREDILTATKNPNAFVINKDSLKPYCLPFKQINTDLNISSVFVMEGLAVKTYNSDIYNNWLQTEWIDGENGINEITKITTVEGSFKIDQLVMAEKVYNMLNQIAASGGSYHDWIDAVYDHSPYKSCESPIYCGGMIKEVVFQEVVGTADTETTDAGFSPVGTLGGKGVMGGKKKGGFVKIKVEEPSVIIGIVSLTPRIDYSQGNKWHTRLNTMDDFHKPHLDQIGFQDLITEDMAFWDSTVLPGTAGVIRYAAGKQPAWINYMTNVNQCYGNFADPRAGMDMFMVLNRRYERDETGRIKDLTTYIDPAKFNYAFAKTRRDAQNFWVQISVDITARRKMSAKVMPMLG